jgi:hypothetical protein
MSGRSREERAVRTANLALQVACVIAVAAAGVVLQPRRPTTALPSAPNGDLSVASAAVNVVESLESLPAPLPADAAPSPPPAAALVTDVVLLPCREPNPRSDGRFLIPPHDPTHRTIVGLPSGPGEPRRGIVIPPHDSDRESRISIEIIALDSILEHTLRVPPHDPSRYKLVGPDSLPCLAD